MPRIIKPISFDPDVYDLLKPFEKDRLVSARVNEAVRAYFDGKSPIGHDNERAIRKVVDEYLLSKGYVAAPAPIGEEDPEVELAGGEDPVDESDVRDALNGYVKRKS